MELIFATNNKNKLSEIEFILGNKYKILSLKDIGFEGDIEETSDTIEGNSLQKTKYIFDRFHKNCFGDDTGLMIDALDGRPGVYSARFAGDKASYQENMLKALFEMNGKENRKARFITVITLFLNDKMYQFEGKVEGEITTEAMGTNGFGYDPIFKPHGFDKTYSQMSDSEKHSISHRALALKKLIEFLMEK